MLSDGLQFSWPRKYPLPWTVFSHAKSAASSLSSFLFLFSTLPFSHFLLYFQGWPTLIVEDLVYSVQSDLGRPGCHSIILR